MTTFSDNLKKQYLDIVKTDTSLSKLSKFNLIEIKSKNSVINKHLSNKDTINFNNFALPRLNDNQYNSLNTIEAPNAKKLQDLNLQDNFFSKIEKNIESLYNKKKKKGLFSNLYNSSLTINPEEEENVIKSQLKVKDYIYKLEKESLNFNSQKITENKLNKEYHLKNQKNDLENNIFGEKKETTSPRNEKIQQNLNYHQYLQSKKFEELINHKNFLSNPLTVNSSQVRLSSDNLDSATNNYYLNIDNFKYPSNKQHRVNYFSKYDKFGNKNLIIFEGANKNYKSCDKNVFSKKDIITKVNLNDFNPNKIHLNKKSVDPYFSIKKI